MAARRPRGTGSLVVRDGSYFGKWRIGGRQVMRKLGPVRPPGTKLGLTKSQAEQELRRRMEREKLAAASERMTVETAGERYLDHLENVMQRASSTVHDYRIMLDRHLAPYFGGKALDRICPDEVIAYMAFKRKHGRRDRKGQPVPGGFSPKTIQNHITFFHGLMRWSIKRGWAHTNPVDAVDRPRSQPTDPDIRFLSLDEVNAVIEAVPDDILGPTDHVLYLTAAMTGLRQGELIALRWSDIDWDAAKVRVRRKWYRGEIGKPKSKRASRGVPLAAPLAEALRRHREESAYSSDGELVLPHPHTGNPYDTSKMRERFGDAMKAAGLAHRYGRKNGIVFHSFRHTFATRCAAAGVPLRTLQEWLGHRDYQTVLIYADFMPDDRREAEFVARAFAFAPNRDE